MRGPYAGVLRDLERLQARRAASVPTPRQLRKCRAELTGLIGRAPPGRLRPLFQKLLELESEVL